MIAKELTPKQIAVANAVAVPVIMLAPILIVNMIVRQSDLVVYGRIMYADYWLWSLIGIDVLSGFLLLMRGLRRARARNP